MPVQFADSSNVREFKSTNAPSVVGSTKEAPTATGLNNGSAGRNINMPSRNTRRNNIWSRERNQLAKQARTNVRAGINRRPMPKRNQARMVAKENETTAQNIKKEFNNEHRNLGSLRSKYLAANANLRNMTSNPANNAERSRCYNSFTGSSEILECLGRTGGKRKTKRRTRKERR